MKTESALLNHPWVKEEIKKEIKNLEFNKNEGTMCPNLWGNYESSVMRKLHSTKCHIKRRKLTLVT